MMTTTEYRTTSEDLLDLVPIDSPNEGNPSPRQLDLMNKLIAEIDQLDSTAGRMAHSYMEKMAGRWTPGREGNASRWIDRLIAKVGELRTARPAVEIEDGMYVLDGEIYKVQHAVHGSGQQYAKLFVPPATEGERATFQYAPGVVTRLRPEHRMSMDQAREYGALYGTCVRCGRVLTREDSIERMMGEICAGKI
jgi:hypothetical protein